MSPGEPERLQKVLARAGYASRRASEDLIRAGRVRINGRVAELGARVDPEADVVTVDGVRAALSPKLVYIALNKPRGTVTTARDPQGRPTVLELVPREPRVVPVGRLDIDTSGLLLLTNDGDFANRMTHPRYAVPKTYVAEVKGAAGASLARKLMRGVTLEDGPARAESANVHRSDRGLSFVEITVHEGRNRIVRRMLAELGLEVTSLVRTAIGEVRLGRLKQGTWRTLRPTEVHGLMAMSDA